MAGTTRARGRILMPLKFMIFTSQSGLWTALGRPVNTTMLRFWMKKETPMALIRAEMRGASLRGL